MSENFRQIYEDDDARTEAEKIYEETEDIKKVDDFCKKILLKRRAKILLEKSRIDKRFYLRTFENFNTYDSITKNAKEKALEYVENIEHYLEKGTNLIIEGAGKVGTGKTHLACAVAQAVMQKGIPAKFINVVSMIAEIKEDFDISKFAEVELLIIDDLGKEKSTDWVCETVYGIINKRYEQMKPTIITTEKPMASMTSHYNDKGKAILSRISEDFILIRLNGEDYRQRRSNE
jgi:DNA replication protein DnaC